MLELEAHRHNKVVDLMVQHVNVRHQVLGFLVRLTEPVLVQRPGDGEAGQLGAQVMLEAAK